MPCAQDDKLRAIELPILGQPAPRGARPRASKVAKWRAWALFGLHVAVALHIGHWLSGASTLTPLEPSEGMQFSQQGVVNAGLILFVLAIASTLVLGRWFCGWACHVVALQDACRWMLGKVGIRPRMVNLGILGAVPWLAFVYMFLTPLVDRVLRGDSLSKTTLHLYTQDFWRTFPNVWVALLTFAVCGFAIVYFLGSKGFCTYGCPYGGIFGAVDQLAPGRIRVTDACEGCGHCTAVCTSNVNVAREVHEYGMVVDPGCMKCMDCVSVCPKEALYFGFGTPALLATRRVGTKVLATAKQLDLARHALLLAFILGSFCVFFLNEGWIPWTVTWIATGFSFGVALVLRSKAQRKSEYTLLEELLLGGFFLLAMLSFRGLKDAVPFLFALGLSAMLAWSAVQLLRLFYAPNAKLQKIVLRADGKWTKGGAWFAAAMLPVIALWIFGFGEQSGVRARAARARQELVKAHEVEHQVEELYTAGVRAAEANRIPEAIDYFARTLALAPDSVEVRENLAGMLCAAGRFAEGIAEYERALLQHPDRPEETHALIARAAMAMNDAGKARTHLETAVALAPESAELRLMLADLLEALGDAAGAKVQRAEAQRRGAPR